MEKTEMKNVVVEQRELPHDLITQNILPRLNIRTLVRCKSVSKQWYSTISSHQFAHAHAIYPRPSKSESLIIRSDDKFQWLSYKNSGEMKLVNLEVGFDVLVDNQIDEGVDVLDDDQIDVDVSDDDRSDFDDAYVDEKLVLVGSCNGLVCLGSTSNFMFILWNPVTREFREYGDDPEIEISHSSFTTWGFGYVSAIDDYKVIRISKDVFNNFTRVDVFSVKRKKWKRIVDDFSPRNFFYRWSHHSVRQGVLVNETLHWLDGPWKIHSFDLGLELFNTLPQFDAISPSGWAISDNDGVCYDEFLCVVKGCLSKYIRFSDGEEFITILKHRGDTEQIRGSAELFNDKNLLETVYDNLIGFTGSDKIFAISFGYYYLARIGIMDLTSLQPMKPTPLVTVDCTSNVFRVVAYSPTLISPNAITSEPDSNI